MRAIAGVAALAALLLPRIAAACPSCAGNDRGGATRLILLGSFVLLPFAIAGLLVRIVKRLDPGASRRNPTI